MADVLVAELVDRQRLVSRQLLEIGGRDVFRGEHDALANAHRAIAAAPGRDRLAPEAKANRAAMTAAAIALHHLRWYYAPTDDPKRARTA